MEEKILLAELTKNCDGKKQLLLDLLQAFDLACLGFDLQEQHTKDIHNRVLQENEFFAANDYGRDSGINVGDRVTDEEFLYLLSEKDFDKVMTLSRPICVAEKLTDKNGYFLENWIEIRRKARENLTSFLVYEIIPESQRHHFAVCLWNVAHSDKLINAFKNSLKKAA